MPMRICAPILPRSQNQEWYNVLQIIPPTFVTCHRMTSEQPATKQGNFLYKRAPSVNHQASFFRARSSLTSTCHKPAIPPAKLQKLKAIHVIGEDHPWGPLRNVWLHIFLYWCHCGWEGQRELTKHSFQFL